MIVEKLSKFIINGISADLFETISFAEKEIDRTTKDEQIPHLFNQIISNYIGQIGSYFDSLIGKRVYEMLELLFMEVTDKTLPNLFQNLVIPPQYIKMVSKEIKSAFSDYVNQSKKERFRDLRGGAGKKEVFVWTDERKIEFYKTVQQLPKIKGKMLWH